MAALYDGHQNRVFQIDNTYGDRRLSVDKSVKTSYYLNDGRDSVTGLLTEAGKLSNSYRYDPYGNVTSGTPDAVNWVSNAFKKTKQTIQNTTKYIQKTASNAYHSVTSADSRFVRNVGNGIRSAGRTVSRTFTSFRHYAAVRMAEIRETVVRELCTTANRISDAIGKVDWKTVAKIAAGGLVIAGLGVATVLTGGAAAGTAGASSGILNNKIAQEGIKNAADTLVNTADDLVHGRDVTLGSVMTDFAVGTITSVGSTKKASATNDIGDIPHKGSTGAKSQKTTLDYVAKIENNNGKYYTDKKTIDEIGKTEAKGQDFSTLNRTLQQSRPSTEGGVSSVYKYSDDSGTKFIIHEVTDANNSILHRDFDAVRLPSGQLINKK